jgi:hypothetical protein
MFDVLKGVYRRFSQNKNSRSPMELRMTGIESLAVALTEGAGDEMTRAGLRFHMSALGATGIAPVQAIPSTAAQWYIHNPAANLPTAWLETLGVVNVSGTTGVGATLYGCIVGPANVPTVIPTASAATVTIKNASAPSTKSSGLVVVSGQTLLNTLAGNWFVIAANPALPTTSPVGQGIIELRSIGGQMAIPPGCGIGLAVVSPTGATPLFAPYASWREYIGDLE